MKTLLITLAMFSAVCAVAPQAEAKTKRVVVVNNYYGNGYSQPRYSSFGGRTYRDSCHSYSGGYYRPSYYQPTYVDTGYYAPVRYYDSGYSSYRGGYCAPRHYSRPRVAVSFGF